MAINTGTAADSVSYGLQNTGTANGATVTPYLTNSSSNAAAQPSTTVSGGAFGASIPARSVVTYVIGGGSGSTVTVTNPGNQTGTVGTPVSLPIQASGQSLTYSATGLPAGLAINSATGLISGIPTTAGNSTVTVTATDGTGASGSATFSWTVSSGSSGGGGCHVTYQPNQWQGGFTANVTIGNTSSTAINGWTLTFTFPGDQKITSTWSGTATQSGENVSVTNVSYNGQIPANGSTAFGFQGTWSASDASPTSFAVNGAACS